jgi:hypothetical protein
MAIRDATVDDKIATALAKVSAELDLAVGVLFQINPNTFFPELIFSITSTVKEEDTLVPTFIRLRALYKVLVQYLPQEFPGEFINIRTNIAGIFPPVLLTVANLIEHTDTHTDHGVDKAVIRLYVTRV